MSEAGLIRAARLEDVPEILAMIRELADYERSLHEVETTEEQLAALLFGVRSRRFAGYVAAAVQRAGEADFAVGGIVFQALDAPELR